MSRGFRNGLAISGLSLIGVAAAGEAISEAEIISRYLSGRVVAAQMAAHQADAVANGSLPALLPNPELAVRHEEARGPAGSTTDAIGGALTLDLGLSSLPARDAARLRAAAEDHHHHAVALAATCTARGDVLSLWAARQRVRVTESATVRMEGVLSALTARAEAGDGAGYDRDRAALSLTSHRLSAATSLGELSVQEAHLSARTGLVVGAIALAPLPSLPPLPESLAQSDAHPGIRALVLEQDAAGKATTAARRSALPDLHLSGGARWDAPPDGGEASQGVEVGAAIELPFFDVARTERRTAQADEAAVSATLLESSTSLHATIEGAWGRAAALDLGAPPPDVDRIWAMAHARYLGGESPIDEMLQVSGELRDAQLAGIEATYRHRRARLDLSCAVGHFDEPEIQAALEESLR